MANANTIFIDIVANNKLQKDLESVGDQLTTFGLEMTRAFTDPIMDLWKDIAKTAVMKEALAPIKDEFKQVTELLASGLVPVIAQLIPLVSGFADWVAKLVEKFTDLPLRTQTVIVGIVALLAAIGPLAVLVGTLITAFSTIIPIIGTVAAAVGLSAGPFLLLVAAIVAIVAAIIIYWPEIKQFFINVAEWAKTKFEEAKNTITTKWEEIRSAISTKLQEIWTEITTKFNEIKDWIKGKVEEWKTAGEDLVMGLVDGVVGKAGELLTSVVKAVEDAYNAAVLFLKGGSPSRLFAELGEDMMKGWEIGIDKGSIAPQLAVQNAAGGMVASAIPSGGRGGGVGNTIVVNYSPVVSLADRYEAETKLVPYIESALRKIR